MIETLFQREPALLIPVIAVLGTPLVFTVWILAHYWGRSRKGIWVVKRQTAPSRFCRAVRTIAQWLRLHRHDPLADQHQTLSQKLRGHFAYYGITGNGEALGRLRYTVIRLWRKWLMRRKRGSYFSWDRFQRLLRRYVLPAALVVHSVYRLVSDART